MTTRRLHDDTWETFDLFKFGCQRRHRESIGSPSRRHPTIIRWLHEGIAKATRRRVAFLDHRAASCILRVAFLDHRAASCILRVAFGRRTIPNGTDYHTKLTRYYKNHSRCTPDALPMHSRWPYEGQNGHTNSTRY